ncbi:mechanosensitive ion channel family protein [Bauldia litoralis]|uniref:mechanosensitive ion channel family protein n=1 Tax=Bauldia litoralis TaxID=665467 RepID=UPI003263D191
MKSFGNRIEALWHQTLIYLGSPEFYAEIAIVIVAVALAWLIARLLANRVALFRDEPHPGAVYELRVAIHRARGLLLPVLAPVLLSLAVPVGEDMVGQSWLVRLAHGASLIVLIFSVASHFVKNDTIAQLLKWVGIPLALLYSAGLLDDLIAYLNSISVEVGNIQVSLYAVIRTLVFAVVLFWAGRASNATGKRVIRTQKMLDVGTREVIAKLFEISIYVLIFLLLINVMGINLTALAVFGGALGVGLGFGLQQIASNFISGIIILLDRSITIGDYIELDDGRTGVLRELSLRSATLETFDGKDIMVPNEQFITTAFVNWTHNNSKQRYPLHFQVAYDTDLEAMFEIVREVVDSHPKVLSGDDLPIAERADAEIESFGDSGINILVEFWMEGIDDGDNRVGGDLLLMIWTALKANGIEIPFPQREVKLVGDAKKP